MIIYKIEMITGVFAFHVEKDKHCPYGGYFLSLKFRGARGWGVWGLGVREIPKSHFHDEKFAFWRRLGLGVAPRFLQKVRAQAPKFGQIC